MCLLIVKKPNANIKEMLDDLEDINKTHKDGFGMAWYQNGQVWTRRSFDTLETQEKMIKYTEKMPALFHWRMSTGGKTNIANCHPFKLKDGTAFAHNGVITDERLSPTKKCSDTHRLASISPDIKSFLANIHKYKMGGSKFAIMDLDGEVIIVNEIMGYWREGVWFSNFMHSYRTCYSTPTTTDSGSGRYKYMGYDDDYEYGRHPSYDQWSKRQDDQKARILLPVKQELVTPPIAVPVIAAAKADLETGVTVVGEPKAIQELQEAADDALQGIDVDEAIDVLVRHFGYRAVEEAIELHPILSGDQPGDDEDGFPELSDTETEDDAEALARAEADAIAAQDEPGDDADLEFLPGFAEDEVAEAVVPLLDYAG